MQNDHTWDLLMNRLDHQDRVLSEIHAETRITNGRVTRLETVGKMVGWGVSSAVMLGAALVAALITAHTF